MIRSFLLHFHPRSIPHSDSVVALISGLLNFYLFGLGTIILGLLSDIDLWQTFIGVLQMFIPILGWIWSIIWGVFIIQRAGWF
jgi:hypothetical protein